VDTLVFAATYLTEKLEKIWFFKKIVLMGYFHWNPVINSQRNKQF
jgi:hypothetical protein